MGRKHNLIHSFICKYLLRASSVFGPLSPPGQRPWQKSSVYTFTFFYLVKMNPALAWGKHLPWCHLPFSCSAASLSSGSLSPTKFWFLIRMCSFLGKEENNISDDNIRRNFSLGSVYGSVTTQPYVGGIRGSLKGGWTVMTWWHMKGTWKIAPLPAHKSAWNPTISTIFLGLRIVVGMVCLLNKPVSLRANELQPHCGWELHSKQKQSPGLRR